MAETYEFPPSLSQYRPIEFYQSNYHPATLKLSHHFFLTRAKIVMKEAILALNPAKADQFVQAEIVSLISLVKSF